MPNQSITLALAQIKTVLGNPQANLETHLDLISQARAAGAGLVCFPELSLTGYRLMDLAAQVAVTPSEDDPLLGAIYAASRDIDVLCGFVERDARGRLFIAQGYFSRGVLIHVHRKCYLPTYAMFDDGRYFDAGEQAAAFDVPYGRAGVLICEDFWHASLPYVLWLDGADFLLLPSASPGRGIAARAPGAAISSAAGEDPPNGAEGRIGTAVWVERVAQAYAALFTNYVIFVNRVGYEDGQVFWGGSAVYGPDGEKLAQAPYLEEALLITQLDGHNLRRARAALPLLRDERPELAFRALSRLLRG